MKGNYKDLHYRANTELTGLGIACVNDKESFSISVILIFFVIAFEIRKGTRKRANLIKAIVVDYRLIKITKNGYDEFYNYDCEFDRNELPYVFRRDKLGQWTKMHDFTYSRLGYIGRYMDEYGKFNKISRFNDDEICIYRPDSVVKGYFEGGNFVVVD